MDLQKKNILIISPQPFEGLFVSKQHYAIELAKQGNKIFFLEPARSSGKAFIEKRPAAAFPAITIITYKPFFNLDIRFHARKLFDWLMRRQVKRILKAIGEPIDILWSFETNLYSNMHWFNARCNIFHVVDPVMSQYQRNVGKSADVILGVSEKILKSFSTSPAPRYFINHGISRSYASLASSLLENVNGRVANGPIRIGYIGNLLRGPVNYPAIQKIVEQHTNMQFHFWGNDQVNNDTPEKAAAFISFMKKQDHVFLHGMKKPEELVQGLKEMDAFLLAYVFIEGESDRSNAHKILEYLCTGKVVISSFVETYRHSEPMICMTPDDNDSELPKLFNKVVNRLDYYNSRELQKQRINLALSNEYTLHISNIENIIKNL